MILLYIPGIPLRQSASVETNSERLQNKSNFRWISFQLKVLSQLSLPWNADSWKSQDVDPSSKKFGDSESEIMLLFDLFSLIA